MFYSQSFSALIFWFTTQMVNTSLHVSVLLWLSQRRGITCPSLYKLAQPQFPHYRLFILCQGLSHSNSLISELWGIKVGASALPPVLARRGKFSFFPLIWRYRLNKKCPLMIPLVLQKQCCLHCWTLALQAQDCFQPYLKLPGSDPTKYVDHHFAQVLSQVHFIYEM